MIQCIFNRDLVAISRPPGGVLLDFLRLELGLRGSKEGCREGDCGACTVLLGELTVSGLFYRSAAACLLPLGDLNGKHIVTIEGLNGEGLSPVQQAIVDEGATQCGFCTPGIVVALTGFLLGSDSLSLQDAYAAVEGNICRCTGYTSIRRACQRLVAGLNPSIQTADSRIPALVNAGMIPDYFVDLADRLKDIRPEKKPEDTPSETLLVAGGTDLFVQQAETLREADLKFLSGEKRLLQIREEQGELVIGAAVTIEELKRNVLLQDTYPGWNRALRLVSSTLIRNRATVAGNLINASPIGDVTLILLALGARLNLQGKDSSRTIPLDTFYQDYKQIDLKKGELITEIVLPPFTAGSFFNFEKVSRRETLDIASVNTAIMLQKTDDVIGEARLSAGGVAPVPLFLSRSSAWLTGKALNRETVSELLSIVDTEIAPIDDVRGSAVYKRRLLRRLVLAHFVICIPGLNPEGLLS